MRITGHHQRSRKICVVLSLVLSKYIFKRESGHIWYTLLGRHLVVEPIVRWSRDQPQNILNRLYCWKNITYWPFQSNGLCPLAVLQGWNLFLKLPPLITLLTPYSHLYRTTQRNHWRPINSLHFLRFFLNTNFKEDLG